MVKGKTYHGNPDEVVRELHRFTTPKGNVCRVTEILPDGSCTVLNEKTRQTAKASFNQIKPLLPKWDVNKQVIVK